MKTAEEIKAEVQAVNAFWMKIWLGVMVACVFFDAVLGFSGAAKIISILIFPVGLFLEVRRATTAGDQFAAFSAYRTSAIMMTSAVVGVLIESAAEREGFNFGIDSFYILFLFGGAGLLGMTLYDRYIARGDAE